MDINKKKLFNLVYGRTFMILILLLIQFLTLVIIFLKLTDYIVYLYSACIVLSAILVVYILNNKGDPSFKLAWIIPILLVPVFGSMFYLFVKLQYSVKKINKRIQSLEEETSVFLKQDDEVMSKLCKIDLQAANLARYVGRLGKYPIYENTTIKYFSLGEYNFQAIIEELEKAEKFIFLEYFIIEDGEMWSEILNILERKVREGVEVRVMYDGMCSLANLPYNYPQYIISKGIACKMFSPIKPALSTHQNNRDHRKILVIDGKVAFNGGVNIGDEYINRIVKYGHWKDSAVMIKGAAVNSFTMMFLQMWNVDEVCREHYENYIIKKEDYYIEEAQGFVMPYGDSPLDEEQVGENVYLDILATAKKYVHIMTPYLVIDSEMIRALTYAAKRGIDIKIILPHIPDKKLTFMLAKTYYHELIEAGVKIYEYIPGFVHSKIFISDNLKAVVGTINLDFRSLYLHFECGTFFYDTNIKEVEDDFQSTLKQCKLISLEECKNMNVIYKIGGSILRIFAPLM